MQPRYITVNLNFRKYRQKGMQVEITDVILATNNAIMVIPKRRCGYLNYVTIIVYMYKYHTMRYLEGQPRFQFTIY